ncbi:hypothetical protein HPB51_024618 [Rhipicephalus microplus]|uniref:Uncharacterized protein n=1 Tax=Rhipicephalus microplus TaxID=6941 RepID=A0A9J6F9P7_RHIMP|nr:hypothetical protein HPB51_024618 [Rhipicephalus microplus]
MTSRNDAARVVYVGELRAGRRRRGLASASAHPPAIGAVVDDGVGASVESMSLKEPSSLGDKDSCQGVHPRPVGATGRKRCAPRRNCFCEGDACLRTASYLMLDGGALDVTTGPKSSYRSTSRPGRPRDSGRGGGRGRPRTAASDRTSVGFDEEKARARDATLLNSPAPSIPTQAHSTSGRRFTDATDTKEHSANSWYVLGQRLSALRRDDRPANVGHRVLVREPPRTQPASDQAHLSSPLVRELGLPKDMLSAPSAGVPLDGSSPNASTWPPREAKPEMPPLFTFGVFTNHILL